MSLELDGVHKAYGDAAALRDVEVRVRDGEFFTLVGPSGCGKTTTLRCIAGLESPDAGRVRFDGTDVTGVPPEERGVGVVFQDYALFPTMSVRENVAYGLRFHPPEGNVEARVEELLDLVDLAETGERRPDELSGGQRQRVALARALAPEPDVLLLDEPLSALDRRLRDRLRLELRRVQRELGVTTVYVTHDQAEALAVSDRLAVMNDGRVEQVGEPEDVYATPRTRFVAEFLGENNCLDGEARPADVVDGNTVGDDAPGRDESDEEPVASGTGRSDERTVVGGTGRSDEDDERAVAGRAERGDEESAVGGETRGSIVSVDGAEFAVSGTYRGPVTLCVRPESIDVDAATNRFAATETMTEFLGDAYRVHFEWNGREVIARLDDPPSGRVVLGFDPADATVLERE